MPLAEEKSTSRYNISGYNPGEIIVNESAHHESLILSAQSIHCPWLVLSVDQLDESDLQPVLDMNPRVVLLGTGERQIFPEARIFGLFGQEGIGLEVMDNGALCRTFNVLVAENREVVAAIIQNPTDS